MTMKANVKNNTPKLDTIKPLISDGSLELLQELKDAMRPLDPKKPQTTRKVKRNLQMLESILEDLKAELEVEIPNA